MLTIQESRIIPAPADTLYKIIADYEVGHQAILPTPYFQKMDVESGGKGEGTITHITMKVMGQTVQFRQRVSEPEPGRILQETDIETGQLSRFILDPLDGGAQTRVTIESEFPVERGLRGILQRLTQPPIVRRIYRKELEILEDYVSA